MIRFLMVSLLAFVLVGCGPDSDPNGGSSGQGEKPNVYVVNYPLAYFAERIAGEQVDVVYPVPSAADPATWEPDAEMIGRFQQADLILLNGADFAKWTLRSTLPPSRMALTTRDFQDDLIEVPDAVTHSHGDEGEHSHAELATKTWLDPQLAIAQAAVIREEIENLISASPEDFDAAFDTLVTELRDLDEKLKSAFGSGSAQWIASRSDFAYLGSRYELDLKFATWLNDESPPEKKWSELKTSLKENATALALFEAEPNEEIRKKLQELGVGVVVLETAAHRPETGDYFGVMLENLDRLKMALGGSPPSN